jgi:hypothetical protein
MAKDKRVEVLFEPSEYQVLEQYAQREHKAVGQLIREAVAKYVTGPTNEERMRAMEHLLSLDGGPVGSPEEIKEEILRGYDEDLDRLYETD